MYKSRHHCRDEKILSHFYSVGKLLIKKPKRGKYQSGVVYLVGFICRLRFIERTILMAADS